MQNRDSVSQCLLSLRVDEYDLRLTDNRSIVSPRSNRCSSTGRGEASRRICSTHLLIDRQAVPFICTPYSILAFTEDHTHLLEPVDLKKEESRGDPVEDGHAVSVNRTSRLFTSLDLFVLICISASRRHSSLPSEQVNSWTHLVAYVCLLWRR